MLAGIIGLPLLVILIIEASIMIAILATVTITAISVAFIAPMLRATIDIDQESISIQYLSTSFEDRLDNLKPCASAKFNYIDDRELGLKKLFRGIQLRCFCVGWFVLNNRSVAYVCVSRKQRARMIETRDGYYLLLDPGIARRIERHLDERPLAA